ncbi:uncharacterized protein VICG_00035 [Vittaforma corneae ATCC 50505]|uniref:Dynein heavy chain coiled coil stalk domain-containing protein n=1 Tax=Vittaforma corneae (strain ATCC 50505) TaxID=993615 RepID=L2GQE3_VITCO|nr:uncharacterized protein VICG_00035 [Vittaforma corneae ATCC 50505]ELA42720.1 hypothetical protein VICG_00035 [Vittaforma corneae ATCC 50505]
MYIFGVRRCIEDTEWGYLQGYLKRDDFIAKVLSFGDNNSSLDGCDDASKDVFTRIIRNIKACLLDKYSFEKVENASKTCAVLYKWIYSIIKKEEVLTELIPLRNEVENIEEGLLKNKREMGLKIQEFNSVVERISNIEKSKDISEKESEDIKMNIGMLTKELTVLESILFRFEKESVEWKYIEFKNPLFIIDNPNILLEYFKSIFIDRNVLFSEDFSEFRKESIEVSMKDVNARKGINNAEYFNRNLIITDVDKHEPEVYDVLKRKMDRYYSYADACSLDGNANIAERSMLSYGGALLFRVILETGSKKKHII